MRRRILRRAGRGTVHGGALHHPQHARQGRRQERKRIEHYRGPDLLSPENFQPRSVKLGGGRGFDVSPVLTLVKQQKR